MLELFEKIIKEEYSGGAECELRTVLSGAEDSVTDDIEVPSSSQASLQLSSLATMGAIDGLTCDFCGADIFQSFFECKTCISSKRDEEEASGKAPLSTNSASTMDRDPVIVCPCCYVEGRACRCKLMNPVQIYPMERLFGDQNRIIMLLDREASKKDRSTEFTELSEKTTDAVQHPPIFASACKLLSARKVLEDNEVRLSYICQLSSE